MNDGDVPDPIFDDPRLAVVYDLPDDDRSDLDAYLAIVEELDASTVAEDLERAGFQLRAVRDAPDRPGRELVFFAQSAEPTSP